MKLLLSTLFLVMCVNCFAEIILDEEENFPLQVGFSYAKRSADFLSIPFIEYKTGDSSSNATEIYVPYTGDPLTADGSITASVDDKDVSANYALFGKYYLDPSKSRIPSAQSPEDAFFQIRLYHNVSNIAQYVHVAVKNGSGYETIFFSTNPFITDSLSSILVPANTLEDIYLRLNELCDKAFDTCPLDEINDDDDVVKKNFDLSVYIFHSNTAIPIESPVDFDTYSEGLYLKYKLSNDHDTTETEPILNFIRKGDQQVSINFSATNVPKMANNLFRTIALQINSLASADGYTPREILEDLNSPIPADPAGFFASRVVAKSPIPEGEITINELINGEIYQFAVAQMNKYGFLSHVSASAEVIPEEMESFLQEQSCYLLSAGFDQDNPMLTYFRGLRDQFLMRYSWGRHFVQWYYQTAPAWAKKIRSSETLKSIFRSFSKSLYFMMTGQVADSK